MKYTEYLELKDLLKEYDITIYDIKESENLNEGLLSIAGKKLLGLLQTGVKNLLSKGISQSYISNLNTSSETIINSIIKDIPDEIKKFDANINKFENKYKKDNKVKNIPKNIINLLSDKKYDAIVKYAYDRINNASNKVKNSIKTNKNLSETDKQSLFDYWEELLTKVNIDITGKLIANGIIDKKDEKRTFSNIKRGPKKNKQQTQQSNKSEAPKFNPKRKIKN